MSRREMTGSKKNSLTAGIALLAALLVGSCTNDLTQPSDTPGADDKIPLLVKNILVEETAAVTRAATAPAAGSSVGVFRQTDSYYTTASNNIKYTLTADKGWQPATAGTDIRWAPATRAPCSMPTIPPTTRLP